MIINKLFILDMLFCNFCIFLHLWTFIAPNWRMRYGAPIKNDDFIRLLIKFIVHNIIKTHFTTNLKLSTWTWRFFSLGFSRYSKIPGVVFSLCFSFPPKID